MALSPGALPPRTRVFRFGPGACEELELGPPEKARELLREGMVTWIDVQGLGDEEMLLSLGRAFGIHPLALADVTNAPQRPKADDYDNHIVMMTRMVRLQSRTEVDVEQVSIFAGAGYVLSFQEHYGDVLDPVRARLRDGNGPMRTAGSGYLAYAILDTIIDGYYPVVEMVSERIERLEDRVLERPTPRMLDRINRVKRDLGMLRRGIWPQLEALNRLAREGSDVSARRGRALPQGHHRSLRAAARRHRLAPGAGQRADEHVPVGGVEPHQRGHEGADHHGHHLHPADLSGRGLRDELSVHARAAPALGLPGGDGAMGLTAIGMLVFFRRRGWLGNGGDDDDDEEDERAAEPEPPPDRSD